MKIKQSMLLAALLAVGLCQATTLTLKNNAAGETLYCAIAKLNLDENGRFANYEFDTTRNAMVGAHESSHAIALSVPTEGTGYWCLFISDFGGAGLTPEQLADVKTKAINFCQGQKTLDEVMNVVNGSSSRVARGRLDFHIEADGTLIADSNPTKFSGSNGAYTYTFTSWYK